MSTSFKNLVAPRRETRSDIRIENNNNTSENCGVTAEGNAVHAGISDYDEISS
jgi:hypothetical protein